MGHPIWTHKTLNIDENLCGNKLSHVLYLSISISLNKKKPICNPQYFEREMEEPKSIGSRSQPKKKKKIDNWELGIHYSRNDLVAKINK